MSLDVTTGPFTPVASGAALPFRHFHRYQLAARLARGRVLDLGCGSGYGSGMLATQAARVWGVDRSAEAVAYARYRFAAANCRYLVGDARGLPFPGGCFDQVVCFGLLEDDPDLERVLDEGRRVLAVSGVLLLSAPSAGDDERSFDVRRFLTLVGARFAHVRLFGHRRGSGERGWGEAHGNGDGVDAPPWEPDADRSHLVAVCSQRNLSETAIPHGATPVDLEEFGDELLRDHARRETETRMIYEKVVEDLRSRLEAFDSRIRRLGREVQQVRGQEVQALRVEVSGLQEQVGRLEGERDALADQLYSLHGSKMWSFWMGYHGLRRFVGDLGPTIARAPRAAAAAVAGVRERLGSRSSTPQRLPSSRLGMRLWVLAVHGKALFMRLLLAAPHALGWLYLLGFAHLRRRRARLRREKAGPLPPLPPVIFAGPFARRPRVLVVSPFPLWPTDHGGAVRIVNLLKRIAKEVDLHLLIFSRAADDGPQAAALGSFCSSVHFQHWWPVLRYDLWGLGAPGPKLFRSKEAGERLRALVASEGIDIVQLEYTEMGQFAGAVSGARTILTEIDITFRSRFRRRAAGFHRRYTHDREFGTSLGDYMRLLRYEVKACERTDQVHVMSPADGAYLGSFLPDGERRIRAIPNAVDTDSLRPPPAGAPRQGILLIGNFQHLPNVDAFDYLVADIWPLVRARCPQAKLTVVGAHTPERVHAYHGRDGIQVVGTVPDVAPYYQGHRLLLAPIRAGSGTRLKILEAMACGLPVVSTSMGAEGDRRRQGEHLLIADTPDELAAEVERLLADDALCANLAAAGRRLVEERYDWNASAERLLEAYRELLPEPDRVAAVEEETALERSPDDPAISVILPTCDGGPLLRPHARGGLRAEARALLRGDLRRL